MAKNTYTVEIVTESLEIEPVRQILEGTVFYAQEVYQRVYSVKFTSKKTALNFVDSFWFFGNVFAEFANIDFTEKKINGDCEVSYIEEYTNETLTIFRDEFCGYIVTKNGKAIKEYHYFNRLKENGEESWEYLHNEFGCAE